MRALHKFTLVALLMAGGHTLTAPASAQDINLNSGSGDIFFLYQSELDQWHTVFRAKGTPGEPSTSGATGLTNPFQSFIGAPAGAVIVPAQAGDTGDHIYDNLIVNLALTQTVNVGGTDFFFSNASGHFTNNVPAPDLGIRIRLREDEVALGNPEGDPLAHQFTNFIFTVNMELSTFNGTPLENTSAHVSLLAKGDFDVPVPLFNTAEDELTATFNSINTHQHRNWGFSEYGAYALVLDVRGQGGTYGDSDHQTTINFNVIPEPSTLVLVMMGLGFGSWLRMRRLQQAK